MSVDWDTRLTGIVGTVVKELEKSLGLRTVGDLLSHYPRTYLELGQVSSLADLVEGELVTLVAEVWSLSQHTYVDKRRHRTAYRTEVEARLGDGRIWMTFFDPYLSAADKRRSELKRGVSVMVSGKFGRNGYQGNRWELTQPEIEANLDRDAGLKPVYPVAGQKLTSQKVQDAVRSVLDVVDTVPERIPESMRAEHDLLTADVALRWIHRPRDWQQQGAAVKRLRFDEAFVAQVALAQRRHQQREVFGRPRPGRPGGIFDAFDARMPFALTEGQRSVEADVLGDLAGDHPMHRLLQGEVGSGKTVVALRAMLRVVDAGGQSALLAPTEVLAQQHLRSVTAMLGDLAGGGMLGGADEATGVTLLTGSMGAAARRKAMLAAASGEAGIVIGTHALIEDRVQFADLGLVVVDEQHRFGVEQRAALSAKSADAPPHVLVMTATPIPRTVAMTVFGDLETSALTELPAGRSPIQSVVVPLADQPGWFGRVWSRVREEVEQGRQVYVVCPRISGDAPKGRGSATDETDEPDLGLDLEPDDGPVPEGSRPPLSAVEEVAPRLAAGPLEGLRVGALHGRLAPEDKDAVMSAFTAGELDVLVSTTVIEVGVDVGNATAMVVLDADRFGISQLHQLRGRVGRGGHAGLCLLVTNASAGSSARDRLDAVAGTTDGFRLAELDLLQRHEGDVLGRNQSGTRRTLRLLSVARHGDVIDAARSAAVAVVERDPDLAEEPVLRAAVDRLREDDRTDYLDKT